MPTVNTRLLDSAAGDDPAVETIVLDEADLMATDEFLQLTRSAERLNLNVAESIIATSKLQQLLYPEAESDGGTKPLPDSTITGLPPFAGRDGSS